MSRPTKRRRVVRKYSAAQTGRLFQDWSSNNNSGDSEIQSALELLRNRSRDLAQNNEYAKRFLNLCKTNIVGHRGIIFQSKSRDDNGEMDKEANRLIELHYRKFCKRANCTVTGQSTMIDVLNLAIESTMRDGEILIRMVQPWKYNPYMIALQLIEADHLDVSFNAVLKNGNKIVMGVEKNKWSRPVAYHMLKDHPGDTINGAYRRVERQRIPAEEIIHFFIPERVNQTRGVPWLVSSAARCKMLDGYEEAELIAARTAASTMGWFVNPDNEFGDDDEDDEKKETIDETFEAEPGTFRQAPEGFDLKMFDPNHPNAAFPDFEKSILRGIAAGWNVSYHSLANDLENINLSSVRHGEMVDRDHWKVIHTRCIDHILTPVFENWLTNFLSTGLTVLPLRKYDKFNSPAWMPRGWHRVDPDKESKANTRDIANHQKSMFQAAVEKGQDLEEIFQDNAKAIELAEENGLELHIFDGEKEDAEANKKPDPAKD